MSESHLIPELENIVGEYTDLDDYKKLIQYDPQKYTERKLRNKCISNIPTDSLIRFSEMYNLAVLYNSTVSENMYLSPDFLTSVFMKHYIDIKRSGLNINSIESNPNVRDEITNARMIFYENAEETLFDIQAVVINGVKIDLYSDIFPESQIDIIFRTTKFPNFTEDYITDVFNDYWNDGISVFLKNPEVYIDVILTNKTQFYVFMYNYMHSNKEAMIRQLLQES